MRKPGERSVKSTGGPAKPANGAAGEAGGASISGDSVAGAVDPASATSAGSGDGGPGDGGGTTPKRKYTKRGTASAQGKVPLNVDGVGFSLMLIHTQLSVALKNPLIAIDESEAKALATAIANVASHYDVGMNEKQQAWAGLAMTAAGVYGKRVLSAMLMKKQKPAPVSMNGAGITGHPQAQQVQPDEHQGSMFQ